MSNQRKSRSKTNQPVGTKFKYGNVWLKVVKFVERYEDQCENCYFKNSTMGSCFRRTCTPNERFDSKSVYFKQIPK